MFNGRSGRSLCATEASSIEMFVSRRARIQSQKYGRTQTHGANLTILSVGFFEALRLGKWSPLQCGNERAPSYLRFHASSKDNLTSWDFFFLFFFEAILLKGTEESPSSGLSVITFANFLLGPPPIQTSGCLICTM